MSEIWQATELVRHESRSVTESSTAETGTRHATDGRGGGEATFTRFLAAGEGELEGDSRPGEGALGETGGGEKGASGDMDRDDMDAKDGTCGNVVKPRRDRALPFSTVGVISLCSSPFPEERTALSLLTSTMSSASESEEK